MLAKRLFQKATTHHHRSPQNAGSCLRSEDVDIRIILHYGVPSTASILAFDPIQQLLAAGTSDGRIKVIGGDNVECLLISPEKLPYKYLEFIHNEGYLISITTDNSIQVWNLKSRCIACSLLWESNITAFSIINQSNFMYVGDEYGVVSVVQYDEERVEILRLPYHIPSDAVGFPMLNEPVVGLLPQPCSSGTRLSIAYQSGLIILWDILKAQVINVRGDKVLQLKNEVDSSSLNSNLLGDVSPHLEEKEISAVCWASCDGSILAVGYVDGDVLFWKTSTLTGKSQQSGLSDRVVKLQLSSSEKRLPVIVLRWWANYMSHRDGDGQLLVYGGDEIRSEEVLTVLNLEWSSGMETVQCINRLDLALPDSFADVIVTAGTIGSDKNVSLFILTSSGRLQIFDAASLSTSTSQRGKKLSVFAVDFPPVISTINPSITVSNLFYLPSDGGLSNALAEVALFKKFSSTSKLSEGTRWALTGGVCNQLSSDKDYRITRLYVAGYEDGSVKMWDATYPVLSSLCILESQIKSVNATISVASVSKLEFCIHTLRLAVGDECGQVRIYDLRSSKETSFHFVTETKHEVQQFAPDDGSNCRAAFSFFNSQVQLLKFTSCGAKLAAGYDCGRIVLLDMNAFSALFITDCVSSPISVCDIVLNGDAGNFDNSGSKGAKDASKNVLFILAKNGTVCTVDADTGNLVTSRPMRSKKDTTAVSMYVIESSNKDPKASSKRLKQPLSKDEMQSCSAQDNMTNGDNKCEAENLSLDNKSSGCLYLDELLVTLCCEYTVRVYAAKAMLQGDKKSICKVTLAKPCSWTTTFVKDGRVCGLVLLYQTGDMEIRLLPNLELVKESSLMSVLRWNLEANVERMMSSTKNGHITLVNGSEMALLSIVSSENDFRVPESLPALHDEVLAAAAKAAIGFSLKHKKKQEGGSGILRGIVKGFKREKFNLAMDYNSGSFSSHLKDIFLRNPSPDPRSISNDAELNIDDIEIDEPVHLESASSHEVQSKKRDNKLDREKLLNDEGSDIKPRLRTREEILATYRKAGDASSVAGQARNKLLERQEKLQRISKQTEELRNGAEDFASLANELVKVMESRKWWQI